MKETHEEKTLLCDQCDFTTNKNYVLKNHIESVHMKKFSCTECDMVYTVARNLQGCKMAELTDFLSKILRIFYCQITLKLTPSIWNFHFILYLKKKN